MNDSNVPVQSLNMLMISMFSALLLAFIVFVAIVGPAEYGFDPTGIGKAMGLTALATPLQPDASAAISCPVGDQADGWLDIVVITVPAGSGLEYKFDLNKDAQLAYAWTTDGAPLYFDFHGEPTGDTTGYFKSFKEDTGNKSDGVLIVPFAGSHGWYWENKSQKPVRLTLKTKGKYSNFSLFTGN